MRRVVAVRAERDRGAAAVEAAIVTPLVMLLIFGIVELGFFFKDYLGASSAIRAGVRLASANPRYYDYAQATADNVQRSGSAIDYATVQQLWVYKANSNNDYPEGFGGFTDCTTCTKFQWDGSAFVPTHSGWPANTQVACVGPGGPPDRIGVYIKMRHDAITGFVYDTLTIEEHVVMSLEPIPYTSGCS